MSGVYSYATVHERIAKEVEIVRATGLNYRNEHSTLV